MGGCGYKRGAGDKRTSQKVTSVWENRKDEGLGSGQGRLDLKDFSTGEQRILKAFWR